MSNWKKHILLLLAYVSCVGLFGQSNDCIPAKPSDDKELVFDKANFIPDGYERQLNKKLVEFGRSTSNQFVVIAVDDLCGWSLNQYSYKLGDKWGLGQEDEDNGLILLIKPKNSNGKGEVYIAPGRGLEGAIPDLLAHRIIQNDIIPEFKKGNYQQGIDAGINKLMAIAKGEYNEEVEIASDGGSEFMVFLLILLVIIGLVIFSTYTRVRNYAELNNIPFWTAYEILSKESISRNGMPNSRGARSRGGYIGGGFPGRGSSGGFGGFGGFGGGSFGGGGAGGSW